MYRYKEETDDGDTYYSLYNGDKRIAEVWSLGDACLITATLNATLIKTGPTVQSILAQLQPVEPSNKALYGDDLDKLITACRQSQEIDTTRHTRRLLMAFLAARLNAYTQEVSGANSNDIKSAQGGLRILITISFITKPGIINGLSRTHMPANRLWSLDAQQYWAELQNSPRDAQKRPT